MKIRGFVKTIDANEQQFKAVDRDARIIEGYFSTKTLDRGGDVTLPSAFEKSLPTFMTNPVVCFQHDWNKPCGKVLDFKADDNGAWVQIQIAKGIKWVDEELWPAIDQGIIKAFSYGYKVVSNTAEKMGDRMVNLLKEVDLMEISVVTIPMNQTCLFSVADTGGVKGMEFVESKGLLRDKLDEEAKERVIDEQISPIWHTFYAFRDCLEDCDPADINSLISEFSDILREQLSGLAVAGTLPEMMKQMFTPETKAGRMISKPNETKIKGCTDKIRQAHKMATEACDELDGMIPEEPEEMKALTEEIIPLVEEIKSEEVETETETKSDMDDPEFQAQVTVLTDMIHQLSELVKA